MRTICLLVVLAATTACAPSIATLDSVAKSESARLQAPTKRLSTYAAYELRPMQLSPAVKDEEGKVAEAATLEQKLRERVTPMLAKWQAEGASPGRTGTLVIEPKLEGLKIVSGGARFWAGGFAGDSSIDLDLEIRDAATGQVLARPRIERQADAMAGGWSVGQSDQNLHDYIASIAAQYLTDNY